MAPLTFADTHNMVMYLSKSDASEGFDQIVDFLNDRIIQYSLMVNPTIYVSCIKQFWATATVKKVDDDVQLRTLIDGKKEIFTELARMGYEKPPPKLTFYKAFFSAQWKFFIHTPVQCLSSKRTAWNEFSYFMASVVICLATGRKFNFSKYIFDSMVRNVDSPSKFFMYPHFLQVVLDHQVDDMTTYNTRYTSLALTQKVFANMRRVGKGFLGVETPLFASMLVQSQPQAEEDVEMPLAPAQPSTTSAPSPTNLQDPTPTPHTTPPQDQPSTPHDSPPQEQPTTPHESSMPILTNLMETCATLSQKVVELEQDKHSQALEILQLKKRVKRVERKKKSKHSRRMHLNRGKIAAIDADECITLVDVETNKETLIKLKVEKAKLLDEQIAQKFHYEEVQKAAARDKQEKAEMERALELQKQIIRNDEDNNEMSIALMSQKCYKMSIFAVIFQLAENAVDVRVFKNVHPPDKYGDIGMGDSTGVSASLDGEIFSRGKKCRESNIGDSDNTRDGGKIVAGICDSLA
nr:hypothetical protein [Tanacetum cinerariifolium]